MGTLQVEATYSGGEAEIIMGWFVLHVGPRTEKKVAFVCTRHSIAHYLPLRESVKIHQRRKVIVQKPLFPGYLFVELRPETRVHVLRTNHILQIIAPEHENQLLYELEQIRFALSVDARLQSDAHLASGTRVRIKAGVFSGLEGYVDQLAKKTCVRLNVELVGQSVIVEVDRDFLEVTT